MTQWTSITDRRKVVGTFNQRTDRGSGQEQLHGHERQGSGDRTSPRIRATDLLSPGKAGYPDNIDGLRAFIRACDKLEFPPKAKTLTQAEVDELMSEPKAE